MGAIGVLMAIVPSASVFAIPEDLLYFYGQNNIVFFDLDNPDQMANDVKWLLDNPDKAEVIARRGYETASKYDTWDNRFQYFIHVIVRQVIEGK